MQLLIPLLTVLFVGLKLGEVITWSWLWVLSPLWIGLAAYLVLIISMGILAALVALWGSK